jgi:hypothetical protein
MQTIREAALRPAAAERYPFLPVRMWTAASHLAELVAGYRGIAAMVRDRTNRVLSDADFIFRGEGDRSGVRPSGGHKVS